MAYLKFENPATQREMEQLVEAGSQTGIEAIHRWRWFGEKALRGDLPSIERLLRENEELLSGRRGRLAILPETDEEREKIQALREGGLLAGVWGMEG